MSKGFGDYIASAGFFFWNAGKEAVRRHEDESIQEEREKGMSITIAALYDAGITDEQIIHLIQKYYSTTESIVQKHLRIEKTIEHPCRELEAYLMREEAFSQVEARDFIINHGVVDMLRKTRGLWKLSPEELMKQIDCN